MDVGEPRRSRAPELRTPPISRAIVSWLFGVDSPYQPNRQETCRDLKTVGEPPDDHYGRRFVTGHLQIHQDQCTQPRENRIGDSASSMDSSKSDEGGIRVLAK
jgi:hypothetical protein